MFPNIFSCSKLLSFRMAMSSCDSWTFKASNLLIKLREAGKYAHKHIFLRMRVVLRQYAWVNRTCTIFLRRNSNRAGSHSLIFYGALVVLYGRSRDTGCHRQFHSKPVRYRTFQVDFEGSASLSLACMRFCICVWPARANLPFVICIYIWCLDLVHAEIQQYSSPNKKKNKSSSTKLNL